MRPGSPSQARSLYRRLYKQIKAQFEVRGTSGAHQQLWSGHLRGLFSPGSSPPLSETTWTDAENLAVYLESNREYMVLFPLFTCSLQRSNVLNKRLMALYWPSSDMTDMERVHKSAARVGLSVPGGKTQVPQTTQDLEKEDEERRRVRDSYGPVPSARKSLMIDRLMCLAEESPLKVPAKGEAPL